MNIISSIRMLFGMQRQSRLTLLETGLAEQKIQIDAIHKWLGEIDPRLADPAGIRGDLTIINNRLSELYRRISLQICMVCGQRWVAEKTVRIAGLGTCIIRACPTGHQLTTCPSKPLAKAKVKK